MDWFFYLFIIFIEFLPSKTSIDVCGCYLNNYYIISGRIYWIKPSNDDSCQFKMFKIFNNSTGFVWVIGFVQKNRISVCVGNRQSMQRANKVYDRTIRITFIDCSSVASYIIEAQKIILEKKKKITMEILWLLLSL